MKLDCDTKRAFVARTYLKRSIIVKRIPIVIGPSNLWVIRMNCPTIRIWQAGSNGQAVDKNGSSAQCQKGNFSELHPCVAIRATANRCSLKNMIIYQGEVNMVCENSTQKVKALTQRPYQSQLTWRGIVRTFLQNSFCCFIIESIDKSSRRRQKSWKGVPRPGPGPISWKGAKTELVDSRGENRACHPPWATSATSWKVGSNWAAWLRMTKWLLWLVSKYSYMNTSFIIFKGILLVHPTRTGNMICYN